MFCNYYVDVDWVGLNGSFDNCGECGEYDEYFVFLFVYYGIWCKGVDVVVGIVGWDNSISELGIGFERVVYVCFEGVMGNGSCYDVCVNVIDEIRRWIRISSCYVEEIVWRWRVVFICWWWWLGRNML